jgi:succinate dehydrogenase/fumarate reductase flavoprotein subunit
MEYIFCDVLVVGSGAAGLRAAMSAKQKGVDVCRFLLLIIPIPLFACSNINI